VSRDSIEIRRIDNANISVPVSSFLPFFLLAYRSHFHTNATACQIRSSILHPGLDFDFFIVTTKQNFMAIIFFALAFILLLLASFLLWKIRYKDKELEQLEGS
jgi:hypothetical protein